MSIFNWFVSRLNYQWLMENMSCKKFASQVASETKPQKSRLNGLFHFWLHWAICPFCRQYWNELKAIGTQAKVKGLAALHPVSKINDIKSRIRTKVKEKVL